MTNTISFREAFTELTSRIHNPEKSSPETEEILQSVEVELRDLFGNKKRIPRKKFDRFSQDGRFDEIVLSDSDVENEINQTADFNGDKKWKERMLQQFRDGNISKMEAMRLCMDKVIDEDGAEDE